LYPLASLHFLNLYEKRRTFLASVVAARGAVLIEVLFARLLRGAASCQYLLRRHHLVGNGCDRKVSGTLAAHLHYIPTKKKKVMVWLLATVWPLGQNKLRSSSTVVVPQLADSNLFLPTGRRGEQGTLTTLRYSQWSVSR